MSIIEALTELVHVLWLPYAIILLGAFVFYVAVGFYVAKRKRDDE